MSNSCIRRGAGHRVHVAIGHGVTNAALQDDAQKKVVVPGAHSGARGADDGGDRRGAAPVAARRPSRAPR